MQRPVFARFERFRQLVTNSLSGRLLVLTSLFVLTCETLILAPVIGRVHRGLLESHILSAELAVMPFTEPEGQNLSFGLRRLLLEHADAMAVSLTLSDRRDFFSADPPDSSSAAPMLRINITKSSIGKDIFNGFECLFHGGNRTLYIVSGTRIRHAREIGVLVNEAPIRASLIQFTRHYIAVSLLISAISAVLVFASLYLFLVRPMRRITQSMVSFRDNPEDAGRILRPSRAGGEIGTAERELAEMQRDLYGFLHQRARLAALGASVARIQHDLRNILATAQLASDRLIVSEDPAVKKLAPSLIASIDRAVLLASNTLKFSRAAEKPPEKTYFALAVLADEAIAAALSCTRSAPPHCFNHVPPVTEVHADREQMFRALLNLIRNAVEALEGRDDGQITVSILREAGRIAIDIADNGPGLPPGARDKLFQPFALVAKAGGTGLGLAIARELMRGHGGDLLLVSTGANGTCFRIVLPVV